MDNQTYQQVNSIAIDKWADDGWEWSIPITHEDYIKAKDGDWSVLLTPSKPVPHKWFEPSLKKGRMDGIKLLGLASGGGQQMPVFSALGADCTVFDNSERQLERDRAVAAREGYDITAVKGDMTKRLPFDDETFDMIFHPVSNCYIEDVYHVWNECFRLLKRGGVLLAGMDNGLMYLFSEDDPFKVVNKLPYNPLKDPELYARCMAESDGSVQFSHTVEEQIGGQLKAGFTLTDLFEDRGTDEIDAYVPMFLMTRAEKRVRDNS